MIPVKNFQAKSIGNGFRRILNVYGTNFSLISELNQTEIDSKKYAQKSLKFLLKLSVVYGYFHNHHPRTMNTQEGRQFLL